MASSAYITQQTIEVVAPDQTTPARITQQAVEVMAAIPSSARVTQMTIEVLAAVQEPARITQLYIEPLGPPIVGTSFARITQMTVEVAVPYIGACELNAALMFSGNVSGHFYSITTMGSEVVPVLYADSTVTISNGTSSPLTQTISTEEEWCTWYPDNGPLTIDFNNPNRPVRTLWIVTSQAKDTPPIVPVWASAEPFSLWKQTCTP
jgi:hypothetical protein